MSNVHFIPYIIVSVLNIHRNMSILRKVLKIHDHSNINALNCIYYKSLSSISVALNIILAYSFKLNRGDFNPWEDYLN